jgi:hypothetical protein
MDDLTNGFNRLSEGELLMAATAIVDAMTANSNFPTLAATVTLVATATTEYGTALSEAANRDRVAIATKNAKKAALITLLRHLGDLVEGVANGDVVKLTSSGYTLAKQPANSEPLTKPNPPVLRSGNPGQVLSTGVAVRQAKSVLHMITPDPLTPASEWNSTVSTSRRHTYNNLESGKRYWFKQGIVGVRSQYMESDAVSYIAQ